jgi:hypothetical protein
MSTVVYKWGHLADCKLLQFIKQQKIHFVNKQAHVTNFLAEKQQMALVVCHSVLKVKNIENMQLLRHGFRLLTNPKGTKPERL